MEKKKKTACGGKKASYDCLLCGLWVRGGASFWKRDRYAIVAAAAAEMVDGCALGLRGPGKIGRLGIETCSQTVSGRVSTTQACAGKFTPHFHTPTNANHPQTMVLYLPKLRYTSASAHTRASLPSPAWVRPMTLGSVNPRARTPFTRFSKTKFPGNPEYRLESV